jgi:tripartite-type tricarboxylate transporter receptor subunit TctC
MMNVRQLRSGVLRAAAICSALSFAWLATASVAADFPSRPITLVVAYAPGGLGDALARTIAERLTVSLKQPVLVENKPGATGAIATKFVAKANPDGYTLLLGQTGEIAINTAVMKDPGYDPLKELKAIALVGDSPLVLVAPPNSPFASVREIAQFAGKGNVTSYASSGTATPGHLAAEAMLGALKTPMTHVPYKGAGPALTDVLGGHVSFFFSSAGATFGHIKAGKLKAIAVSSSTRMAALPNTPTVAETLPGFSFGLWGGVFAPTATPADVIAQLNREINKVLADPAAKQKIEDLGAIVRTVSPDEFARFVANETGKYQQLVKQIGIKPE